MKNYLKILVASFLLVMFFASCEKTTEENIVGKWIGRESTIDEQEDPLNNIFQATVVEFHADGTGSKIFYLVQPFTWTFDAINNNLQISSETVSNETITILGDTIDYKVLIAENRLLRIQNVGADNKVYVKTYKVYKD